MGAEQTERGRGLYVKGGKLKMEEPNGVQTQNGTASDREKSATKGRWGIIKGPREKKEEDSI